MTPDRNLAGRVAAAWLRFGIVADDSAGESLAESPPAVFLRLLVRAVAEELAPVPLLALLKHPLCGAGISPIACRQAARTLETLCLRGPRPMRGISGLRRIVDKEAGPASSTAAFLSRLEACLEPALRFESAMEIATARRSRRGQPRSGWRRRRHSGPRGYGRREERGLSRPVWRRCVPGPPCRTATWRAARITRRDPEGEVVRSRRALRGRGGPSIPAIFIGGPPEARRSRRPDRAVEPRLSGRRWSSQGPWLSRPMRTKVGLPAPE